MPLLQKPDIFNDVIRDEKSFTFLLYNFLLFDSFREQFFKLFLDEEKAKTILPGDIEIEPSLKIAGIRCRPDIAVIKDEFDIYIEIKIWPHTQLTNNQPDKYFKHLARKSGINKKKYLGLLSPKHFNFKDNWNNGIKICQEQSCTDEIKIVEKHLLDVAEMIDKNELIKIHQAFGDFEKLIRRLDLEPVILTKDELQQSSNIDWMNLLLKVYDVVENVYQLMSLKVVRRECDVDYYGFYFKDAKGNSTEIWFGCYLRLWRQFGKPFALGITDGASKTLMDKFKRAVQKVCNLEPMYYQYDIDQEYEDDTGFAIHFGLDEIGDDYAVKLKNKIEPILKEIFSRG